MPRHDEATEDWIGDIDAHEYDYSTDAYFLHSEDDENYYYDDDELPHTLTRVLSYSTNSALTRSEHQHSLSDGYTPRTAEEEHGYTVDDDVALSVSEERNSITNKPASNDTEHVYHCHNDALSEPEGQKVAEIPDSIEPVAASDKVKLMKILKDGIDRCKQAMQNNSIKLEQDTKDANRTFDADIDSMNDWHGRLKTQDLILNKRKEIHVRLPTNQVITPVHNALVGEDSKEGILIAESFRAIKTEKIEIRAKLASRVEKAEDAHTRECAALSLQITCLRNVAELSGVNLDDTEADEVTLYEPAAPVIRIRASTPALLPVSIWLRQSNDANANKHQNHTLPVAKVVKEDCYNCSRLQEQLSTAHKTIYRIQAAAPVPDMKKFIKHGEQILSELIKQRDTVDEEAGKALQNKKLTTKVAFDNLASQHARIKKIHIGIGHLWEHESKEIWQEMYDMCREELIHIKREQQALENLDFRCEDKLHKRQCDSKELLVKQIKFYDSLLSLARSHVVNRWGSLVSSDSDIEADSE